MMQVLYVLSHYVSSSVVFKWRKINFKQKINNPKRAQRAQRENADVMIISDAMVERKKKEVEVDERPPTESYGTTTKKKNKLFSFFFFFYFSLLVLCKRVCAFCLFARLSIQVCVSIHKKKGKTQK
jgi:hypothetical protein